ncbi:hypothetical protein BKA67DRAFT_524548 [Truncatella angustata]|uniref:Short-chain alcohol dehydrogenase n=1 Tax=Truncatella angustata TaxID=152316 RepID=A0A9P8RJ25_9PEZI|nr:uncharacterized protein BKA67DRAFT_524548 [Truncatella angustata]KAH6646953.1 hypothetical protein BKA67DRAFT_524548 [Truncatella angustata]
MAPSTRTLFVIGIGPGIGRSVTSLFASKRYANVALFARRATSLATEKKALEDAVGGVKVGTYAVDVADGAALSRALDEAEAALGKPECVFYNAARVQPSELLSHDVGEIEVDFKINVSSLYIVAQRVIPSLIALGKADAEAIPSLVVTSSMLPHEPMPQLFALSLAKAAQRNLVQSLEMTYGKQGVHLGLINVGGPVSPEHDTLNPTNIADRAWDWFSQLKENPQFEVKI